MATSPPVRLRRRGLLAVPAIAAAALTVVFRPAPAAAAPPAAPRKPVECVADLLGGS